MKRKYDIQLAQLVDMKNPAAVFEEVKHNFVQNYSINDFIDVRITFNDFNDLFDGKYPGYQECNTRFHDKMHTTDALLAISRLIDGYNLEKSKLPVDKVKIALIATVLHDSGYIQTEQDTEGTGAKYTLKHVERSINFIEKYFQKKNFSKKDFISARNMVGCTGLGVDIRNIEFTSQSERILSLMLGTADLIGQMASRTYLERLLFLYQEFKEGNVAGFGSELDLLEKTLRFYDNTKDRLKKDFNSVYRFVLFHFRKRYRINRNLYQVATDRQMRYLKDILTHDPGSYQSKLRRNA